MSRDKYMQTYLSGGAVEANIHTYIRENADKSFKMVYRRFEMVSRRDDGGKNGNWKD
jgi:hypothetical protein